MKLQQNENLKFELWGKNLYWNGPLSKISIHFVYTIFFSNAFSWKKIGCLIWFWLKFDSKYPIKKKSALVQVMARHPVGDKLFPEPIMTQFIDA